MVIVKAQKMVRWKFFDLLGLVLIPGCPDLGPGLRLLPKWVCLCNRPSRVRIMVRTMGIGSGGCWSGQAGINRLILVLVFRDWNGLRGEMGGQQGQWSLARLDGRSTLVDESTCAGAHVSQLIRVVFKELATEAGVCGKMLLSSFSNSV